MLSSKDIGMVNHLDDMKNAGVDSLKIEGRMKSLYYVSMTVRAYRKAIDALEGRISIKEAQPYIDELYKASHREFATGFFYNREDADKTTSGESFSEWELAATIGSQIPDEEMTKIAESAKQNATKFHKDLENMHPEAKIAKEKDLEMHPEKVPNPIVLNKGFHLYECTALNRIDTNEEIEYVGPDCIGIKDNSFSFIDPETGNIETWTSHNHPFYIYTDKIIKKDWILRIKSKKN